MQIPLISKMAIRGVIDRRVLVNFRVDPDVLAKIIPAPFQPQTVNGYGIAGICLIRLKHVRPKWLPACTGTSSENAAHRIAVQWQSDDGLQTGVYVPRRDTNSTFNTIVGGRVFPGVHQKATFDVEESNNRYRIDMRSIDGKTELAVDGRRTEHLPVDSVFKSVSEVSEFFAAGSLGYSPNRSGNKFEGLELRTDNWQVTPLTMDSVRSSFFDDRSLFPKGSVKFDNALLMKDIHHEWHYRNSVCC